MTKQEFISNYILESIIANGTDDRYVDSVERENIKKEAYEVAKEIYDTPVTVPIRVKILSDKKPENYGRKISLEQFDRLTLDEQDEYLDLLEDRINRRRKKNKCRVGMSGRE